MSEFQQRDGSGQLFRNDRAESDKHPSHKGTFLLNGVTYEIAAWIKDGKKGRFFSLKVQEAGNRPALGAQRTRTPGEYPEPQKGGGPRHPVGGEDDIPFGPETR